MEREKIHLFTETECYQKRIRELSEMCDNEYYQSAMLDVSNLKRATRAKNRILKAINELEELGQKTKCIACLAEINQQIERQRAGLNEIEFAWSLR